MEKIVVFDDHPLILEGLEFFLNNYRKQYEIVGTYRNASSLKEIINRCTPDIVILDISLGEENGVDICKYIIREKPQIRIIAFSGHAEGIIIDSFLSSGGIGYIVKSEGSQQIINAIEATKLGQQYLSPKAKLALDLFNSKKASLPILTRREKEIVELIKDGKTINEIAEILFISTNTVITHRKNILSKFDASNMMTVINNLYNV